jgi:hypothetical protein
MEFLTEVRRPFIGQMNGEAEYGIAEDKRRVFRRAIDRNLKQVVIPADVSAIGARCFDTCTRLSEILFEAGSKPQRIETRAFFETALKAIAIPASVEEIADSCFWMSGFLAQVAFESEIGRHSSLQKLGIRAFSRTALRTIAIPSGCEEIGEFCFCGCRSLCEVIFGREAKLRRIQGRAFRETGLRRIAIPSRVEEIGEHCFNACGSLVYVRFNGIVARLAETVFSGCRMTEVWVPGGMTFSLPAGCKGEIHLIDSKR